MVNEILQAAGFTLNENYRETRFLHPPKSTYAVFMESYTVTGPDDAPLEKYVVTTIELYEYFPDPDAENRLEAELNARYRLMREGWEKQNRYWIEEEQLYQVVYTFEHIEK